MKSNEASFRFYAELNDFLPQEHRLKRFPYYFKNNPSIKDAIEASGVPHAEVDLILVNSHSVDFNYSLQNGDSVAVYPVFEKFNISPLIRLRANPLRNTKFILDVHLGKLAKYLRLLGFDTLYRNDYHDPDIVKISVSEQRIILTRDQGLLKNKTVTHGYWLRAINPQKQIEEVLNRFDLFSQIKPFQRCLVCNGEITAVAKSEIADRLLARTARYYMNFYRCSSCEKIYWQGSHYKKMAAFCNKVMARSSGISQDIESPGLISND